MKLVIDTNVFVSSFYFAGNPRKVFDRVTDGLDELFITDDILAEIVSVMSRKKFNSGNDEIAEYINIIENYAIKLLVGNALENASRDQDDNKILQCGLDGNVDYIITGDNDLLVLKEYNKMNLPEASLGVSKISH